MNMQRIRHLRKATRDESGAALPLIALMLVALLGIAAFSTDLGWFYLNASRIQRTADASALAGVIWMPTDLPKATTSAREIATANGYEHGADAANVTVSGVPGEPTQLDVTVADTVPTFFLRVLGFTEQTIVRSARAEYVPPLPLGSPDSQFGNSCDPRQAGCSGQPNFWANIHGKYTATGMGDAFSPYCTGSSGSSGCAQNPSYRPRGYLYGIEASSGFNVQFLDIVHHNTSGDETTNDNHRTGDRGCEDWGTDSADCGQTVRITLYAPDPTPLDITDNTAICSETFTPEPQLAADDPYNWVTSCGVASPSSGIYVLQVQVVEPSQANFSGLNRYSVRATGGARLYGLGDVSLYNNFSGSSSEFYLAQVSDIYAGKTLVVEMYDPGDAENNVSNVISILGPGGTPYGTCSLNRRTTVNDAWVPMDIGVNNPTASPCQIVATRPTNNFDSRWIQAVIDLPASYSCSTCWWKVRYNFSGTTQDTTTWRAYIEGNPIHLIRN